MTDCLWIAGLLWDLLAVLPISIMVSLIHSIMDCITEVYCGRPSLDSRTAVELAGSVAHIHNGWSNPLSNWIVYLRRIVADSLWIAGLLWNLLAALPISIMVSLIHSIMDCITEVYCGRPSLDSRTAVRLAGSVAPFHNGQSYPLPNGLYFIPEAYCGRPSPDSRTAVGLAGSIAHIHNGQSYPLPNGLYT